MSTYLVVSNQTIASEELVRRLAAKQRADTPLKEDDKVEILAPRQGG